VAAVIQQLYEQTPLQIQFHASFLALIDGRPQHCSLRRLLQEFLAFRELTLQRCYAHEGQEVAQQIQRLQALHQAITHLDVVFTILRECTDVDQAKTQLMSRLHLTAEQAETVLSTPLTAVDPVGGGGGDRAIGTPRPAPYPFRTIATEPGGTPAGVEKTIKAITKTVRGCSAHSD
jgi:DNA gyrase/topoisomerase IV subunit A